MGGRVYAKILSNLKDGMLANWIPSLNGSLPAENRRVGIKPGDVGMVTPHGGFDFGYNIFRDSDDPFNLHGAPEGHEPLQEHSWSTNGYYPPGHVTKREQRSAKSFNAGVSSVFGFNAGVLVDRESGKYASCSFPEGANFEAFQNTGHLKQYMKENGDRLVDFLYKTLGRQGDPVVVIECIKTPVCVLEVDSGTAWSTGASASALASAHLEFGITTTVSGSRITREISSDEFGTPNKCPFMKVIHLPRRRFGRRWTTGGTSEAVGRVSSATIPASINNGDVDLTPDVVDARSMSMHSDSVAPTPLDDRAHNDNGVTYGVPIHSMNAVVDTSTALPESCSSAVNSDDSGSCLKSRNLISVPQETFTQSPGNEPSLLSTLTSHSEPPSTTPSFSNHSPMNAPPSPTSSTPSSMRSATSFAVRDSAPEEAFGYEHSFLSSPTSSKPHVDPLSQTQAFVLGLSLAGTPDGNGGEKSSKATVESVTKGDNGPDGNWPRQDQFMNALHRQEISNLTSLTNSSPKHTDVDHEFILSEVPAHSRDPNVFSNCTEVRGDKDAEVEDSAKQAPGSDVEDDADPTPFAFTPFTLARMFDHKDLEVLEGMGGTSGLLMGLGTHRNRGLDMNALPYGVRCSFSQDVDHRAATENDPVFAATLEDRRRIYGENVPSWTVRTHSRLMWQSLVDIIFVLVTIGVIIFLVLGLFEDFRSYADWGEDIDFVAVCIMGIIGSLNDWRKQRQLRVNDKEEGRLSVVRGGVQQVIDIKEAVVGDIAIFEPDEIIPCDGVFLSGDTVECRELVASGKSIAVRKVSYEECKHADAEDGAPMDCFVVSGSKVVRGVGSYVVVTVGTKSLSGRITMALQANTENTPLQLKLSALADFFTKLGRITAVLRFFELGLRFYIQLGIGGAGEVQRSYNDKLTIAILVIIVTLIVAAFARDIPRSVCSWFMERTTTKIVPEDRRSGLSC